MRHTIFVKLSVLKTEFLQSANEKKVVSKGFRVWKGYLGIPDLTRNVARDSGKRKIYLRDTGFDRYSEAGFAKILAQCAVLGKKTVFVREVRDAGLSWK